MTFMRPHYLKGNKKCEQPSSLIFVSVCTRDRKDKRFKDRTIKSLRLGVSTAIRWDGASASRRETFQFLDATEFWAWLLSHLQRKKVTWVYCYNAHLTMTVLDLWDLLDLRTFKLHRPSRDGKCRCNSEEKGAKCWRGIVSIDKKPWFVQADTEVGRVNFLDIGNYWSDTIETLAADNGIRIPEKPGGRSGRQAWTDYVSAHCDTLEESVTSLMREWRRNNCGNWKMTAGALAFTCFSHMKREYKVVINPHPEARNVEEQCLYGGQISCWFRGETIDPTDFVAITRHEQADLKKPVLWQEVYELDCRSLYPAVMRGNQYPYELLGMQNYPSLQTALDTVCEYSACCWCKVRAINQQFPYRKGNVTVFPEGYYWTFLCGPELRRALESDAITDVQRLTWYKTAELFTDYINLWWPKRLKALQDGNKSADSLYKMLLNCLYGKFNQRKSCWIMRPDKMPPWPWRMYIGDRLGVQGVAKHRSLGFNDYQLVDGDYADHAFPAISAFVTSYAREYMRVIRQMCPEFSVLYQHTDCLIVTKEALDRIDAAGLIRPEELGYFKQPRKISWGVFRGPNNITIDCQDRVPGVSRDAKAVSDGWWKVDRLERMSKLFGRPPDGTLSTVNEDYIRPECHVGQRATFGGWWEYEPVI